MAARQLRRTLPAIALLALLVACGGNNSSNNNTGSNNTGGANPGGANTGNGGGVSSSAEYLYTSNPAANDQSTFSVYRIESGGTLTQVATATIPVRAADHIRTDSTGTNVFVTGFEAPSPNMDLVKVNPSGGTITPSPGQVFQSVTLNDGNCCPSALAVDSSGQNAYVGGLNDGYTHFFRVDPTSGSWNQVATYKQSGSGGDVYALALDPAGRFLYSSQRASSRVSAWLRANDGTLTALAGAPFETNGLTSSVSISPDGKFLFVPHYELSAFDIYRINSDGTLTVTQANIAAGNAPSTAVTDPQQRFLYVSNTGAYNGGPVTISEYKFDASSGTATPIAGSPVSVSQAGYIVVDPSGKYLFGNSSQGVIAFSIDQTTGALTPISGTFPPALGIAVVRP